MTRNRSRCKLNGVRGLGVGLLLPGLAAGCGSGDGLHRRAISGIVTLDGRPLEGGAILLEPTSFDSGTGTAVGATIRRGEFTVPRAQGPIPGRYRVRIYASSGVQAPPREGQTDKARRPMVERIPDVYNTRSELRAEVRAQGRNRYRFELRASPPPGAR
jgi:hypothetical protein